MKSKKTDPSPESHKAPRRRPAQARSGEKLQFLLEAVDLEVSRCGAASVNINDIAARAGLGVGSIYHLFPTKEALLAAWEEWRFQRVAARVMEHAIQSASDPGSLSSRVSEIVREVCREIVVVLRLARTDAGTNDLGHLSRSDERGRMMNQVAEVLESALVAIQSDELRKGNPRMVARVAVWTVVFNSATFSTQDETLDIEVFVGEMADLITRYLVE